MVTGLNLENLAQVVHADKQHTFTQECLLRQVEWKQGAAYRAFSAVAWWAKIRSTTARPIVITFAVHPLRLTVQWV